MKHTVNFKSMRVLLACLLTMAGMALKAQNPTYELYITNQSQVSSKVYKFDVYLLRTGSTPMVLSGFQFGLGFDTSIVNGGTLTFTRDTLTSQLAQTLPNPGVGAVTAVTTVNSVVYRYLNQPSFATPSEASATTISNSKPSCASPGTRIGTYRLTNTKDFKAGVTLKHIFSTAPGTGRTNTIVSAFVGGLATSVTVAASNLGYQSTNTCDQNLALNGCAVSATITANNPVTCFGGSDGSVTISLSGLGSSSTGTYSVDGGSAVSFSTNPFNVTGLSAGSHNISITSTGTSSGSCGASTGSFNTGGPASPLATPTVSTGAATCSAIGTASVTNYSSGNTYAFTPSGPSVGAGGAISGLTAGTSYTVTATNGDGCSSSASSSFSVASILSAPSAPTVSTGGATCSAIGTASVTNYSASLTYTFSPSGPTVGSGGAISGLSAGTNYTVTATNSSSCTSSASASFSVAAQLSTPATPTVSTGGATCSAIGTASISNYSASLTYTFSPSGPTAGTGGAISGLTAGTSYTVIATNTDGCNSSASSSFSVASTLSAPATPSISVNAPTCSAAGTASVSNYSASLSYTFSPSGPTVGLGGAISGLSVGTSYTVTATGSNSCTSGSSTSFSIAAQVSISQSSTSATVCSYNLPYVWNGDSYSAAGTYTKTGLTAASGCDSIAILNLTVAIASSSTTTVAICPSALPYVWNGITYTGAAVDTVNFSGGNANGCDSIAILNLSIKQSTQSITYRAICSATGQTTSWNGDTYAATGVYTTPLVNAAGCDSLAILDLTATATAPLATASSAITQTLVNNNCGARVYRYTASVVANAVGYAWDLTKLNTLAPGAVVDSGDATFSRVIRIRYALNAAAGSTDSIAVRPFSGCGQGARKAAKLSNLAWTPLAAPSITARNVITNVCNGRLIRYSVPVPATTAGTNVGYLWSIQGSTLGATAVIDSGTATSRQILVLFSDNRAAGGDDSIVCRYVFNDGCAFSRRASKIVLAALATPAAPKVAATTINSNECGNRRIRYTITSAFLPGATATAPATTGIEWTFTGTELGASATIDSPSAPSAWATANAIVVRFASNEAAVTTDSVRARYTTACGFGLYSRTKVALTRLRPATPLSITIASVPSNECGTVRFRYTAPAFPLPTATTAQATGYDWDFASMGSMSLLYTIDSGDVSGRAIIVKYATTAAALSTDSIRVRFTSSCGSSAFRAVKLTNVLTSTNPPVIPASILISIVDTTICGGRIYRYTAPVLPAGTATNSAPTGYLWSMPTGPVGSTGTLVNGTTLTSRIIDVAYSSNAAATSTDSIRVAYTSPCGAGPTKAAKLTNLAKTNCLPTSRAMPTTRTVPTTVPMDVKVFPNPSTAAFNMQVKSVEQEVVEVRILDAQGRFVRALRSVSNATINFGSDLRSGVYMVEVRQGNKVKTTRIVKL